MYPTADGHTSQSGNYIPTLWSGKLLDNFYKTTVFGAIANTDYEGMISRMGDKVVITMVPELQINDYVIGDELARQKPNPGKVELLIDKGKYYSFEINRVEEKQATTGFVDKWAESASEQLKIAIDKDILSNIHLEASSDNIGENAGAISGNINMGTVDKPVTIDKENVIDKIVECSQVLDEQNVPDLKRWIVIPAWLAARIKSSDLKDASMTGDGKSVLRNGRIGMIDRFEVYLSNNVGFDETAGKVFHVIFGHKSSITFASQLVENRRIPNPLDFGDILEGLQVYGYKVIKSESMGVLTCK